MEVCHYITRDDRCIYIYINNMAYIPNRVSVQKKKNLYLEFSLNFILYSVSHIIRRHKTTTSIFQNKILTNK